MRKDTDYYKKLGISKNASYQEIRKAYHKAAQKLHPDVNLEVGATELFLEIKEAYEILVDPIKRTSYDNKSGVIPTPPVRIKNIYSRNTLSWSSEKQLIYSLISMDVFTDKLEKVKQMSPLNVVIVLDCSTSMQGRKLEFIKSTAIEIVRSLRNEDIFSLVTFYDRAKTVITAAPYANNIQNITQIRMLQTRGGTEIYKGLKSGFNEVRKNIDKKFLNHIILITDGHTYGDEVNCQTLAKKCAEEKIGINCLGIGEKWNDVFLESLATITGGSCYYIKEPRDIPNLLKHNFLNLGNIIIDGISLELHSGPGIELNYAFRLKPVPNNLPISSLIKLGNLSRGDKLSLLLEFLVSPIPTNIKQILLADGCITFSIPTQKTSDFRIPINLSRNASSNLPKNRPNEKIVEAISRLNMYRMQENAKILLQAGKFQAASKKLKNLASNLHSKGDSELAETVLDEVKNIDNQNQISEVGQKKIKYGTQALFLSETTKETDIR
jgi:Ca-activated chloride channel family protein